MRHHVGTSVSGRLDVRRMAKALEGPGIDTRFWVATGIVATVDDDGNIQDDDPKAVYISRAGVEVDVVLLPSQDQITCRVASGGPGAQDFRPVHPGDEVLVLIPDGEHGSSPVVVALLNGQSDPIATDGSGRPLFANDRRLIWAAGVPIDLRTGPVRVELRAGDDEAEVTAAHVVLTSGDVRLGGAAAAQQLVLGTSFVAALTVFLTALSAWVAATNTVIQATPSVPGPAKIAYAAACGAFEAAIAAFNQGAAYLSQVSRTR